MPYDVYILQSLKVGSFYVGSSQDSRSRLARHNKGKVHSTKKGVPWIIIYKENYATRQDAYKRERQIKSYKGGEAFHKLISWVGT